MAHLVVGIVAFVASMLTFFTGFGLGTLLLPAFGAFFPAETAVALTAIVHLLNNLFKLTLVARRADKTIVVRFGVPAVIAAFAGALLLAWLADQPPLFRHSLLGREAKVLPVSFVIAVVMITFALLELWPKFKRGSVPPSLLPIGGVVTGFFGGLSGHQGALRSIFLLRAGLDKAAFIATGVVIAVLVDLARLAIYSQRFLIEDFSSSVTVLATAVAAAFAGALVGNRVLEKVSLRAIEIGVAVLLVVIAIGMGLGVL